jgi:thiol-disulfide isomerase/thioredoxin
MSKLDVGFELENVVKRKQKVFVLFYASWCPFSQRFLPIFQRIAENIRDCLRVVTDDRRRCARSTLLTLCPQC